jgi:hypothetical protein
MSASDFSAFSEQSKYLPEYLLIIILEARRGSPRQGQGCGSPRQGRGSPRQGRGSPFKGRGSPFKGRGSPFKGQGAPIQGQGPQIRYKTTLGSGM